MRTRGEKGNLICALSLLSPRRVGARDDVVVALADDLAVLDDDGAEAAARALLQAGDAAQPYGVGGVGWASRNR